MFNPLQLAQAFLNSSKGSDKKELEKKADGLLKLLWQSGAWKQLPAMMGALKEVMNKEGGVLPVVVRSAKPISETDLQKHKAQIFEMAEKFGAGSKIKSIDFKNIVDPELTGGIVLEVAGMKLDGSVLAQLEKFKDSTI